MYTHLSVTLFAHTETRDFVLQLDTLVSFDHGLQDGPSNCSDETASMLNCSSDCTCKRGRNGERCLCLIFLHKKKCSHFQSRVAESVSVDTSDNMHSHP